MKIGPRKIYILLLVFSNLLTNKAYNKYGKLDSFIIPIIQFKEGNYNLDCKSRNTIDTLFNKILLFQNLETFLNKYQIVLSPISNEKEFEKDNFIGVKRCTKVIDYLEEKYKLDRYKVFVLSKGKKEVSYDKTICGVSFNITIK